MFVKKTTLFNHKFVNPARMWGFYLEGFWLWRISGGHLEGGCLCEELSGGYSQEMMGFVSLGFRKFKSLSSKNTPEML